MQQFDTIPTIFLVDDDDNLRESIKRNLRHEPYNLIAVDSPAACLELMSAIKPHVIISDLFMPDINGSQLLAHFKDNYPDVVRIMISGNFNLNNVLDAVNSCNVFRCIEKPCQFTGLALAIREALKYYQLIAQSRELVRKVKKQAELLGETNVTLNSDYDLSGLIDEALKEVNSIDTALLKYLEK
jgi:DNA-binding NtrC family response regulator